MTAGTLAVLVLLVLFIASRVKDEPQPAPARGRQPARPGPRSHDALAGYWTWEMERDR